MDSSKSILLIGESDVGKTHYGAQILRRLNTARGAFELVDGTNLTPFRSALEKISLGLSAAHTPRAEYSESTWLLRQRDSDINLNLVWPDYGGEQVSGIVNTHSLPANWRDRITRASGWVFMIRPSQIPLPEDILTRAVTLPASSDPPSAALSPQSKLVELLQMLLYKYSAHHEHKRPPPPLAVLLSCYDELTTEATAVDYCRKQLPMLYQYISSNWPRHLRRLYAVSPLGQPLSQTEPDDEYAAAGPETRGFVIDEEANRTSDLLVAIEWVLSVSSS